MVAGTPQPGPGMPDVHSESTHIAHLEEQIKNLQEDLRETNAAKYEYISNLHAMIFGLGDHLRHLRGAGDGNTALDRGIRRRTDDLAGAYSHLTTTIKESKIYREGKVTAEEEVKSAQMKAETIAQEARAAEDKAKETLVKAEAVQREFQTKQTRSQVFTQELDDGLLDSDVTEEEKSAARVSKMVQAKALDRAKAKVLDAVVEYTAAEDGAKAAVERARDAIEVVKRKSARAKKIYGGERSGQLTQAEQQAINKDLFHAVKSGCLTDVQALLAWGATVDARYSSKHTAPLPASKKSHLPLVETLIAQGANIDARNSRHWTTLIWASNYGHVQIAQALISQGANIDAQDSTGNTSMILATFNNRQGVVQALIRLGANPGLKNITGYTALYYAKQKSYASIVQLLEGAGVQG